VSRNYLQRSFLMIRRSLLLGVLVALAALLLFVPNGAREAELIVFAVGLILGSLEIAYATTRRTAFYGASGMVAGMAVMMAAMGTGLAAGYAAGMVWSLGWANLVGVVVGFGHGLIMGRRYGPMAALDGAGGGVMGGLMGPMLGVMLLYQPTGLVLTAILMLALQAVFSLGAAYLVAEAAGRVGTSGLLFRAGQILGAQNLTGPLQDAACAPPEAQPAKPTTPSRGRRKRVPTPTVVRSRARIATAIAAVAGAFAFLILTGGLGVLTSNTGLTTSADLFAPDSTTPAVQATVAQDGVQELTISLSYPRYTPRLLEAKSGLPLRLTLEAVGDPG
jgi:hypothetical protein